MRQVVGTIVDDDYRIFTPFRMLVSGSSGKLLITIHINRVLTM